ncbi:MAG: hypothetical protein A2X64_01660, partial [Ignavibacteria bacterium GWF2_33_9]
VISAKESNFLKTFLKIKKGLYQIFFQKSHLRHREPTLLKSLSKKISHQINQSDADIVFAFGSLSIAYLETDLPVYMLTDATFDNLLDFYQEYKNVTKVTLENAKEIEQLAFEKASHIFFSSDWAAKSAIVNYSVPAEKISVVPLGANLNQVPNIDEINKSFDPGNLKQINLLSFGKYWERKGHDRAFAVLNSLLKKGANAQLTIVGCDLPADWEKYDKFTRTKVTVIGNLNKDISYELEMLETILKKTHFLLFLSRAETFGHVVCEANAFGIPVIAANIGGIPSAVRDGINGFLVDEDELPDKAVNLIMSITNNQETYNQLSMNSKIEYEERLNWDNSVKLILEKIVH